MTPIEMNHTLTSSLPYSFSTSIIHVAMDDNIYNRLAQHIFTWFCFEAFGHVLINNCVLDLSYSNPIHLFSVACCCIVKDLPSSSD